MPAPAEIIQLVELFQRNYDQYRDPAFSEAAVRLQFIDPFFAALGWDMYNVQEFAEQYKEVVHEDKVRIGGATKAPDYSFRIGKERKFFVEAKKPTVDIQHDIDLAYHSAGMRGAPICRCPSSPISRVVRLRLPIQARSHGQGIRGPYLPAVL